MEDINNYFDSAYNLFHNQSINDATLENAMEVPELEAIFANSKPGEYFQHVLSVAIHQHYVLEKIKSALSSE